MAKAHKKAAIKKSGVQITSAPPPKKNRAKKSGASARRGDQDTAAAIPATGPLSLEEALALVQTQAPARTARRAAAPTEVSATHRSVAEERDQLDHQIREENKRRIHEYQEVMSLLESRGVKGLKPAVAASVSPPKKRRGGAMAAANTPLRILAEGDSWFSYPVPFFGGGIIPRLQSRLGLPILSLAKAGDEVRVMLGVEERKVLMEQLVNGSPNGGSWDLLLFSGGGNDIVGNPMALWVKDFDGTVPPATLLNQARFDAALALVKAGYQDLIQLRDSLSPATHLVFHGYDFVIPDGRGVCGNGPWLKPTFDLRGFPAGVSTASVAVVREMLQEFAAMLQQLQSTHTGVTFINTQGTLTPVTSSWHNELHPSSAGFDQMAGVFKATIKSLFPARVP